MTDEQKRIMNTTRARKQFAPSGVSGKSTLGWTALRTGAHAFWTAPAPTINAVFESPLFISNNVILNDDPFNFIKREFVVAPIVEPGCPR